MVRLVTTGVAYMAATGFAVALTRFGGGAAFLWVANAVLLASLATVRMRRWPMLVAVCYAAGIVAGGLWGVGWRAGPFVSFANVAEPVIAAILVTRWGVNRSSLDSPHNLSLFVLAAGILAPATTGLIGALVITLASGTGFAHNFNHWFVGHALGALTFTPIFALVASGEVGRWFKDASRGEVGEATLLLVLVAVTSLAVFAQSQLPMLFLPVLPIMVITFRVGRIGSSLSVVVLAVIGIGLTLAGHGPVNLMRTGVGERLQFLQFYLAVTLMTVLPVAADLARRLQLFQQLRDSEARFRLLTEHSTDIVMNLDVNGTIRYVSPSIALLGGHDPEQLIGTSSVLLVDPDDRARVTAIHRQALCHPAETFSVEYRDLVAGEKQRWFETRTRAVIDEDGVVRGVVSAVRDTSVRRQAEVELSRAALTDPLTGLCNRRAFDAELAERLARAGGPLPGCVALFDLDHFKRINDRFGHATGDDVLRAFARMAEARVRSGDMLARVGGEEFALIFSGITEERAHAVCERIREAVAATSIKAQDWPVHVTVSIGIAAFQPGDDADGVMQRADQALYRSKQQGRNRSSLAA